MAAREIGELLADALEFCLLLADADPTTLRPSDSEMASLASLRAVRLDRNLGGRQTESPDYRGFL
jgi:hypothetical protein